LSGRRGSGKFRGEHGLQGGVHVVTKPSEAYEYAQQMLGNVLVTDQAPQGVLCNKVMLMQRLYLRREMYFSIVMDRASQGPIMIASSRGGMSIQTVIQEHPELIYSERIDIMDGVDDDQALRMATHLGLDEGTKEFDQAVELVHKVYRMFDECDCTQIEINPVAETPDNDIVCVNAKVNFDDYAAYRQSAIFAKRDNSQEDPREAIAEEYKLNYIGLDGNIGCMVNGGRCIISVAGFHASTHPSSVTVFACCVTIPVCSYLIFICLQPAWPCPPWTLSNSKVGMQPIF